MYTIWWSQTICINVNGWLWRSVHRGMGLCKVSCVQRVGVTVKDPCGQTPVKQFLKNAWAVHKRNYCIISNLTWPVGFVSLWANSAFIYLHTWLSLLDRLIWSDNSLKHVINSYRECSQFYQWSPISTQWEESVKFSAFPWTPLTRATAPFTFASTSPSTCPLVIVFIGKYICWLSAVTRKCALHYFHNKFSTVCIIKTIKEIEQITVIQML